MRIILDIDTNLIQHLIDLTGEKNKGKAINKALVDWVRVLRVKELKAMAGKIDLVDNLKELEELELKDMERMQW